MYSEQITLKVRALDTTGTIYTYTTDSATVGSKEEKTDENQVGYQDWELIQKLKAMTVANGATPGEEAAAKSRIETIMSRSKKRNKKRA